MALIVAQLLFVDRVDDEVVRLDVIVLERAQTPVSPAVGACLAFDFQLPSDPVYRQEVTATLGRWAQGSATVELSLLAWRNVTKIVLGHGSESVILAPPSPVV